MLLLLRFLPFAVGVTNALLFAWQSRDASSYPWLIIWTPFTVLIAGFVIGWKRMTFSELVEKLLPAALAVAACGYGLLLVEGWWALSVIPLLAGGVSFLALELLFLLAYLPTRYPVNGLSHLNLTLVPPTVWLAQYTSVGLTVFVHASRVIPIFVMSAATALLFWSTSHVEASGAERGRWAALGAWLGLQAGLMGAFLPVSLALQGGIAALAIALALRSRRYEIAPRPSFRFMLTEVSAASVLLLLLVATARWA